MQDPPSPESLLEAVAVFLRERAVPALPPHQAYEAKVAANAVDLVRRALAAGPAEAAEHERLRALLGRDGTLEALTRDLAERLADGRMDLRAPGLAEHLALTADEKIAVDQPGFAADDRRRTAGKD